MRTLTLIIDGKEVPVPRDMVASHVVVQAAQILDRDPDGLVLRRVFDGSVVAPTAPIGFSVRDRERLRLVKQEAADRMVS